MLPTNLSRRKVLGAIAATGCVFSLPQKAFSANTDKTNDQAYDEETLLKSKAFLKKHVSVDLHAHPGLFFMDTEHPSALEKTGLAKGSGPFPYKTMADMHIGNLSAFHMATVADRALLGVDMKKGKVFATRAFEKNEAWTDFKNQNMRMDKIIAKTGATIARTADDILQSKKQGKLAVIKSTEGASFIDHDLSRLKTVYDMGYRSLQIVHYHVNQIGDIQTEEVVYGGLSDFGKEVVTEMEKLGLLIDLAHASEAAVEDTLSLISKPVIVSHSSICSENRCHPRYQTPSQAKMVSDAGGVIGISPAGFINQTFDDFIGEIDTAVSTIGIDYISALGTDMDGNYKPVFANYRNLPYIPAALFNKGYTEHDVAKLMGGNYLRVSTQQ